MSSVAPPATVAAPPPLTTEMDWASSARPAAASSSTTVTLRVPAPDCVTSATAPVTVKLVGPLSVRADDESVAAAATVIVSSTEVTPAATAVPLTVVEPAPTVTVPVSLPSAVKSSRSVMLAVPANPDVSTV